MTKKQSAKPEKRDETPLTAEVIAVAAENVSDLARKLSDVAEKMNNRKLATIDSRGWKNLNLAIEKLGGAISSVERAYRKSSVDATTQKVADERSKYKT